MAKAKKLPSGNWRVQVFSHYETAVLPDGTEKKKRIYESFTAATKREAERMAAVWAADRTDQAEDITVLEAVQKYINAKTPVLSPSTVREYKNTLKNYFSSINNIRIRKIDNTTIQIWISSFSERRLSPKSVRNIYTLLSSTLLMFRPDFAPRITLPQRIKPDLYCPSDEDIKKLLEIISGTELEIAVLLAAFGPLRRGEICALTVDDIDGNVIHVRKSMVMDENKQWVIKQPKTPESKRDIVFPDFVIAKFPKSGKIIQATPSQISDRFRKIINRSDLPHFRFHDLRHYAASIMHAVGVPDQYIMSRGGWKTDGIMKSVYRNVINLEEARQTKIINTHFENLQHDMQHKKKKAP